MNVRFFSLTLLFFSWSLAAEARWSAAPQDSVGLRKRQGKTFILHRVAPSETLFSIARRYGAVLSEVQAANPRSAQVLSVGDTLEIPFTASASAPVRATTDGATHTVAPGETLYAISRQYGISIDQLKKLNQLTDYNLSVGQTLRLREAMPSVRQEADKVATAAPVVTAPASPAPSRPGTHIVAPGETLFAIATRYEVQIQDLQGWNQLSGNQIVPGQQLLVTAAGARADAQANPAPVITPGADTLPVPSSDPAPVAGVAGRPAPEASPEKAPGQDVNVQYTGSSKVNLTSYDRVVENGLAAVIEGVSASNKYIALHKTAPVGTILQIRNDMNDASVFVKVIGRLPDTGNNDKVVVRISEKAFQRLRPVDKRFPVEISYIP